MLPDPKDPSYLGALIYFHHAASALSFSRAAEVLNVTPSAVSHRITALEGALGKRLFERRVRQVHLTQDGIELARATAPVWEALKDLTTQMTRQDVLRVSIGPYLSSQWLLPRIGAFEAQHPGLRVDLIHLIGTPRAGLADVSIVWADIDPEKDPSVNLFDMQSIPVTAPGLAEESPFWAGNLPPIHYRDRSAWRHWLAAAGAPLSFADRGEVLEEPTIVLEAAAYGRGIAIGFLPFIATFFEAGRLVPANPTVVRANRGYRLDVNAPSHPKAEAFESWIANQAKSETIVAADFIAPS